MGVKDQDQPTGVMVATMGVTGMKSGGSGIRTHETLNTPTRFPSVRTRPDYATPPALEY